MIRSSTSIVQQFFSKYHLHSDAANEKFEDVQLFRVIFKEVQTSRAVNFSKNEEIEGGKVSSVFQTVRPQECQHEEEEIHIIPVGFSSFDSIHERVS